eukprot:CAMPEP_0119312634 /NCGR_PEP_ID=MMETSP1333-20130426/26926_1 /TAXON_ID=418940 /ORGANISM="Scyphosphaera apsteinii, Strain RCC1455" /LENGTH=103 /DNA_ID=CAMNT_0007317287 /DNA_START=114 /DNA_END=425 /DNA_ORIENTATION=-
MSLEGVGDKMGTDCDKLVDDSQATAAPTPQKNAPLKMPPTNTPLDLLLSKDAPIWQPQLKKETTQSRAEDSSEDADSPPAALLKALDLLLVVFVMVGIWTSVN